MRPTPLTVREGYALWAHTYDAEDNPLIRVEERAVSELITQAPGRVLDAACGTGRHARRFAMAGSLVVGVDSSAEMLAVASSKARELDIERIEFVRGTLGLDLPMHAGSVDLAVCALALCHVVELREAITALCGTVRSGGHLLITDLHPSAVKAGLVTLFSDGDAEYTIETARHSRAQYVEAIASAGAQLLTATDVGLGDAFEREPLGLPTSVYEAGWEDLPFCLVLLAQVGN